MLDHNEAGNDPLKVNRVEGLTPKNGGDMTFLIEHDSLIQAPLGR